MTAPHIIKKLVRTKPHVPQRDEDKMKLKDVYNQIIDELVSYPVIGNSEIVAPQQFFKRLATWMGLAMVGCTIDKLENAPNTVQDIDDICKLADDVKALQTVPDFVHFIDSLYERARGYDGTPFGCWTVCDIAGTFRGSNFDNYYKEILNYIIDTPVPSKR